MSYSSSDQKDQQQTQKIKTKDDHLYEQNEKLREILKTQYETEGIQQNVMQNLNDQSQQLDKVDNLQNDISSELNKTEYYNKGIKSWWGGFKNIFRKPKKHKENKNQSIQKQQQNEQIIQDEFREQQKSYNQYSHNLQQKYGNEQERQNKDSKEIQQEELLDELINMTGNIKNNGILMNRVLDEQNDKVDKIEQKFDKNNKKMDKCISDQKKILRN